MLNWIQSKLEGAGRAFEILGEGSTKFLVGALLGAVGGFAAGSLAATSQARLAGQLALGSLGESARFVGRVTLRGVDELGDLLESGYTRIRGREAYLEHEIEELREKITRLDQRVE